MAVAPLKNLKKGRKMSKKWCVRLGLTKQFLDDTQDLMKVIQQLDNTLYYTELREKVIREEAEEYKDKYRRLKRRIGCLSELIGEAQTDEW